MSRGLFALAINLAFALSMTILTPAFAQSPSSLSETRAAIQSSVAKRLTIPEDTVAATIKNNIIQVSIRSTKPNVSSSVFHAEASAIEEEVVSKIANNPDYKSVHTIRIKYVEVAKSGRAKTLHVIDYRRNVHGIFESHTT